MTKKSIIEQTIEAINQLPEENAAEISNFAGFVLKRYEEHKLTASIQQLAVTSKAFDFLLHDEDLYSKKDLKEVYND